MCIPTTLEIATNPVQRKCPNTYGALKTRELKITWEIVDHAIPYQNGSKRCDLCATEKYHIIGQIEKLVN